MSVTLVYDSKPIHYWLPSFCFSFLNVRKLGGTLKSGKLNCVLHVLSPAEDARQQRGSFSVVLLEWRASASSRRREGGTLDSLHGSARLVDRAPTRPNAFWEDEEKKSGRTKR